MAHEKSGKKVAQSVPQGSGLEHCHPFWESACQVVLAREPALSTTPGDLFHHCMRTPAKVCVVRKVQCDRIVKMSLTMDCDPSLFCGS